MDSGQLLSWRDDRHRITDEPWEKVLPPYVENIGVFPTWPVDYMTSANLSQSGKPFVDAFVASIVNHILQPVEPS